MQHARRQEGKARMQADDTQAGRQAGSSRRGQQQARMLVSCTRTSRRQQENAFRQHSGRQQARIQADDTQAGRRVAGGPQQARIQADESETTHRQAGRRR